MNTPAVRYANVILPLKLKGTFTYSIPKEMEDSVAVGSWVAVSVIGRRYLGVISSISDTLGDISPSAIRPIMEVKEMPPVSSTEMEFWENLAEYYLCSVGEVFKCAYPSAFAKQTEKKERTTKRRKTPEGGRAIELSPLQTSVYEGILKEKRPSLIYGVTGSGKTEIYLKLATDYIDRGKSVLYLVPEIALSRQLQDRMEGYFADKVLVWHSKQTAPEKKRIFDTMKEPDEGYIILGTRSAVFLPPEHIGLIIIDEEHDSSYKQNSPAPRYNGRDTALMLAAKIKAKIVLGSATPSLESWYNVVTGKFASFNLPVKYHNAPDPDITIIDMNEVYRLHNAKGAFSMKLVNMIADTLKKHEQVMIFKPRKAYGSFIQCDQCGHIPICPHCNVSLNYHKYKNALECHYCGYSAPFVEKCPECKKGHLVIRGAGTEKIEEELCALFPEAKVARLDSEITKSVVQERAVLEEFEKGVTDILVGTQMISKGFDFKNLTLVAVVGADSLLSMSDFRADEKAEALFRQLMGRCGRREKRGRFVIQTFRKEHPVFERLAANEIPIKLLSERKLFGFPPHNRLISIILKDKQQGRLRLAAKMISERLKAIEITNFTGPITPVIDKIQNQYILVFWIRLPKNSSLLKTKKSLEKEIEAVAGSFKPPIEIVADVDPL